MRKIKLSIICLFIIPVLSWGAEINLEYRNQVLNTLEAEGLTVQWEDQAKAELVRALYQERISLRVVKFVSQNLPEDLDMESVGGLQAFLMAACAELDPLIKRGLEQVKARLLLGEFVKTAQRDSQRQRNMLNLYAGEENESPEAQYRYRKMFRYQQDKETEAGGKGCSEEGGGGGPPGPPGDQGHGYQGGG